AKALCDQQQKLHSLRRDTYAAISSRSPRSNVDSPRSRTSASWLRGIAVSGRKSNNARIPGIFSSSSMCGICPPTPQQRPRPYRRPAGESSTRGILHLERRGARRPRTPGHGSPDGIRTRVTGLKGRRPRPLDDGDRKSTRLNSSHVKISYAVFCLKKKK